MFVIKKLFALLLSLPMFQLVIMNKKIDEWEKKSIPGFRGTLSETERKIKYEEVKVDWESIDQFIATSCNNDPNFQDFEGNMKMTLLHYAVKDDRLDMVKFLVKNYKINPNLKDYQKRTPLDIALRGKLVYMNDSRDDYDHLCRYKVVQNDELIQFLKNNGAEASEKILLKKN